MSIRTGQPSLGGGEVSDAVSARWDVAKYGSALARARNVLGRPQGGQYIRSGFLFADEVEDHEKPAILLPFVFSAGDAYSLEFTPLSMRVYYRGALVTRPKLTITGITREAQAVVTVPASGYQVGWVLTFSGIEGMVEINGLRGTVVSVAGDDVTVDIDTTGFSPFTGDTGGVPGDAEGGQGGTPPPPPPGEDPPLPELPNIPELPPTTGGWGNKPLEVLP